MGTCTHVGMCACEYVHFCVHSHMCVAHGQIYICVGIRIRKDRQTCMLVCVWLCICMCVHMGIGVLVCLCMYVCTHLSIPTEHLRESGKQPCSVTVAGTAERRAWCPMSGKRQKLSADHGRKSSCFLCMVKMPELLEPLGCGVGSCP